LLITNKGIIPLYFSIFQDILKYRYKDQGHISLVTNILLTKYIIPPSRALKRIIISIEMEYKNARSLLTPNSFIINNKAFSLRPSPPIVMGILEMIEIKGTMNKNLESSSPISIDIDSK